MAEIVRKKEIDRLLTYIWQVVYDPTRTGEYPGLFYKGLFRRSDLLESCGPDGWPDGIIFQNIQTGERRTVRGGQLCPLTRERL